MRVRRTLIAALGVLIAFAGAGAAYEAVSARRDRRDPPGRLVDVGGRRLHVLCIGAGNPTVIFEPASRSRSVSFAAARTAIARHTRVCSYDRMGTGWSDDGPAVVTVGDLAADLRRLQENTPIAKPVVIVASSMGGFVAEMYARQFPDRVAGLVFVDAGNSEGLTLLNAAVDRRTRIELDAACAAVRIGRPIGVVRLFDSRPRVPELLCAAISGVPDSIAQFAHVPPLRSDMPIVALTAETTDDLLPPLVPKSVLRDASVRELLGRVREESHRHLAAQSTRGSWRLVRGSGHVIAERRPDSVVDAVNDVLRQVAR